MSPISFGFGYRYLVNLRQLTLKGWKNTMTRLAVGDIAPDFSLPDHTGRIFTLSEVLKTSNALLVFNIGFA